MTATTAAEGATATCGFCLQDITMVGGDWTAPDGIAACYDLSAPYVPHVPASA